jgi:hypothetical protein
MAGFGRSLTIILQKLATKANILLCCRKIRCSKCVRKFVLMCIAKEPNILVSQSTKICNRA